MSIKLNLSNVIAGITPELIQRINTENTACQQYLKQVLFFFEIKWFGIKNAIPIGKINCRIINKFRIFREIEIIIFA